MTFIIAAGLMGDAIFHFTEVEAGKPISIAKFVVAIILGVSVFYLAIIPLLPQLGPEKLRAYLIGWITKRELAGVSQDDLKNRVYSKLNIDIY